MTDRAKILVVDDAPLFRELGTVFLGHLGDVVTAGSALDAIAVAGRESPDVVVLDLELPDACGAEVCRQLKSRDCAPRVVAMTSGELPDDRARAVQMGADDVVAKPLNRIALIQAVRRQLVRSERALPRVDLDTPVQLEGNAARQRGVVRNLSRGGIYVEADGRFEPGSEVQLGFRLPPSAPRGEWRSVTPTARIVWQCEVPGASPRTGLGLQFLALDTQAARAIDTFIQERAPAPPRSRDIAIPTRSPH